MVEGGATRLISKATLRNHQLDADARFAKKLRVQLGYAPTAGKDADVQLAARTAIWSSTSFHRGAKSRSRPKESAEQGVTDAVGKHKIGAKPLRESKR